MKNAMMIAVSEPMPISRHAMIRIYARRFTSEAVEAVLTYGRICRNRDAEIHVIGRKEVAYYAQLGIDLREYEGIQVLCSTRDRSIITAYRNHDFRGLRPRRRSDTRRRAVPAIANSDLHVLARLGNN